MVPAQHIAMGLLAQSTGPHHPLVTCGAAIYLAHAFRAYEISITPALCSSRFFTPSDLRCGKTTVSHGKNGSGRGAGRFNLEMWACHMRRGPIRAEVPKAVAA
jgi:hypothetical protein